MKKIFTLLVVSLMSVLAFAQSPKLSYQAVVRDSQNKLMVDQPVTITVNVLNSTNTSLFEQIFSVNTNRNGLISIEIGDETEEWSHISWSGAKIRTAISLPDGAQLVDTTNVTAVPFAMFANSIAPSAIPQSDWAETDREKSSFILNKPDISAIVDDAIASGHYVSADELKGQGFLTADSTVIKTMQGEISDLKNHTSKEAIRDSVAGQIHDSLASGMSATHTHDNKDLLDTYTQTNADLAEAVALTHSHSNAGVLSATTAAFTKEDSTKLAGVEAGAEKNVNADWNATSGAAEILNKPEIPVVSKNLSDYNNDVPFLTEFAEKQVLSISNDTIYLTGGSYVKLPAGFSGKYEDLTGKPEIPTVNDATLTIKQGTTTLGSFTANAGKDTTITIPAGAYSQENADWNATSGVTQILNKPTIPSTVAELADADNYVTTTGDQEIAGNKSFTGTVTVPSGFTLGTTTAANCSNVAVNACDLLTVFDSIQRQFGAMQNQIDDMRETLKNLTEEDTTWNKNCGDTLTDIDGNKYATVEIGSQCWMKENLKTTRFANGDSIGTIAKREDLSNMIIAAIDPIYYYPNGDSHNKAKYGLLYNAVAASSNICPSGWHVPSDAEWKTMELTVGMSQSEVNIENNLEALETAARGSIAARLCDTIGWNFSSEENTPGNPSTLNRNATQFSVRPAGYVLMDFEFFNKEAMFRTLGNEVRLINFDDTFVARINLSKQFSSSGVYERLLTNMLGASIRCVKD